VTISASIERKAVIASGVETAYLDAGRGPALVALHGLRTSSQLFAPLLPHLDGYRFIAPDLLGHGRTRAPDAGRMDHAAYAQHLRGFLDLVPPRSFHLMVHGLGGLLGLAWATARPERVESLTILSTAGVWSGWRSARSFAMQAFNLIAGRSALRVAGGFGPGVPREVVREWIAPWTRRRVLRGLDHFDRDHVKAAMEGLGSLRIPALVVWGGKDRIFPKRHAEHIRAALPHARWIELPNAGHYTPLDAPEELAREVVAFIKSVPR
jgi:pimeloyl-ACP methyl ester carboxylesterase